MDIYDALDLLADSYGTELATKDVGMKDID